MSVYGQHPKLNIIQPDVGYEEKRQILIAKINTLMNGKNENLDRLNNILDKYTRNILGIKRKYNVYLYMYEFRLEKMVIFNAINNVTLDEMEEELKDFFIDISRRDIYDIMLGKSVKYKDIIVIETIRDDYH